MNKITGFVKARSPLRPEVSNEAAWRKRKESVWTLPRPNRAMLEIRRSILNKLERRIREEKSLPVLK